MEKNSDKTSVIIRDVGNTLITGAVILLIISIIYINNPYVAYVSPLFDSLSITIPYTLGELFSVFFKNAPEKFGKKSFITSVIVVVLFSIISTIILYNVIFNLKFWLGLSIRGVLQFSVGLCLNLNKILSRYDISYKKK